MPVTDKNLAFVITSPLTASENTAGIKINTTGIDGLVALLRATGVVTETAGTLDIAVEESDDNSTYTQLTAIAQAAPPVEDDEYFVPFVSNKKYVRLALTVGGTLSVTGLTGHITLDDFPYAWKR